MTTPSFYSQKELEKLNLKSMGIDVKISRKASLYCTEEISVGNHVRIDDFSVLSGRIEIGDYVHIAAFCGLYGSEGIYLGDFSGLSARVTIYSATDDYSGICLTNPTVPLSMRHILGGAVRLGRHAIVGAGSVILPRVQLGCGAAIGAMSLVSLNVDPWSVHMGIPARPIGSRQKELLRFEDQLRSNTELVPASKQISL